MERPFELELTPLPGESFLASQFRVFYREVARCRARARANVQAEAVAGADAEAAGELPEPEIVRLDAAAPATGAQAAPVPGTPPPGAPGEVWRSLLLTLERQALAARRTGGDYALKVFAEAQYVMAAVADEIFLHLDWGGRETWQSNLLESRIFHSHRAGDAIFERIEQLLTQRNPVVRDLAEVYLMALGLGFQGKWRDRPEAEEKLAEYRRRLHVFLFDREPELGGGGRLFPQAYGHTLALGPGRRLPHLRPWLWGFALLALLWVLVSIPLWHLLAKGLVPLLDRIL